MTDDYDSPWKDILDLYFADFMAFFMPTAHAEVDWSRGWESLDTELSQIVRDADLGKRYADKLMKVWRRDGAEQYVLIHIEVQGERDSKLPRRMFVYHYRLFDAHQTDLASIAILGDEERNWRPDRYRHGLWGCELEFRYPVVKLLDYQNRRAELEASANPFAVMVLAHLATKATRHDPEARRVMKFRMVKALYARDFSRQDIMQLLRFIDWLLTLPPSLAAAFREDLQQLETTMGKPYVTSFERDGFERGIHHGRNDLLRKQLFRRFGALPDWLDARLEGASEEQLETWAMRVLDAQTLEEIFTDE